MENLTITKEKVLEAASKCSQAKETLKVLFPECFDGGNLLTDVKAGSGLSFCYAPGLHNGKHSFIWHDEKDDNFFTLSDKYNWDLTLNRLIPTKK